MLVLVPEAEVVVVGLSVPEMAAARLLVPELAPGEARPAQA